MARVIQNLVYRVSVSAIVGAIVAGGLIYLNNEHALKSFRGDMAAQVEQQSLTNKALMEANEELASAVGAIETENTTRLAEFGDTLRDLSVKIDDISEVTPDDYSMILDAISAANAELSVQIADVDAKLAAIKTQEP